TPFALRIDINPPGSLPAGQRVATLPLRPSANPRTGSEPEAKQADPQIKRGEGRGHFGELESKAEAQERASKLQLRHGQELPNVTFQQDPSQEAKEKREKEERMLKEERFREEAEQMLKEARLKEELSRAKQEQQNPEFAAKLRAEREAKAKSRAELAKQATVTMQQAIQIALSQHPGTVLETRLIRERGQACYFIGILTENGAETNTISVLVNAIDGSILRAIKEEQ